MEKNKDCPALYRAGENISATVNGVRYDVLETEAAYFVTAPCREKETVELVFGTGTGPYAIRPKRLGIAAAQEGRTLRFQIPSPLNLLIEPGGEEKPLFFYGVRPETYDGKATYYFPAGQVYQTGELRLRSGESVYIERGAVVRGMISAYDAENIKIYGQGILDNSYYADRKESRKTIRLVRCSRAVVQDITLIKPTAWMIMIAGCRDVTVSGIHEIGEIVSSDGIDIVGSQNVTVSGCMLRNNDDCVVVKHATQEQDGVCNPEELLAVRNIEVKDCVLYNAPAGNALEIGFELNCEQVSGIRFQNIDILRVDGIGAALSIHVSDRALVRDVLYDHIYIEHYYSRLIDFRVVQSQWGVSAEKGRIEDVTLQNIFVTKSIANEGYSVSVIGGYDDTHLVKRVKFSNFCFNGSAVCHKNELDLFERNTEAVEVVGDA